MTLGEYLKNMYCFVIITLLFPLVLGVIVLFSLYQICGSGSDNEKLKQIIGIINRSI